MLVLLLRVGDDRFGLDARDVDSVVPAVPLVPCPRGPAWLAGLLRHRDALVPVVDLAIVVRGTPADRRLSTRIVLVRRDDVDDGAPLGLLAEGVTETARIAPERLRSVAVDPAAAPWRGPVALPEPAAPSAQPSWHLVRWTELVPADVRALIRSEALA